MYGQGRPVLGRDGVQSPAGVAAANTIPRFACWVGVLPCRQALRKNVVFAERYLQALRGSGSPICEGELLVLCFTLALERARVQFSYPHRKQSHQRYANGTTAKGL